jgi:hypothetical protein
MEIQCLCVKSLAAGPFKSLAAGGHAPGGAAGNRNASPGNGNDSPSLTPHQDAGQPNAFTAGFLAGAGTSPVKYGGVSPLRDWSVDVRKRDHLRADAHKT